jgi:hypothetical protein
MFSKTIHLTFLLTLTLALPSCDPGIAVVISNKSNSDKQVKAIYPPNFKLPQNWMYDRHDSLRIFEIDRSNSYKYPLATPILSIDTVARTYSFLLKPGHKAIVESRWPAGYPTFGQIFIIDNRDTIALERHGEDFIKKPKLLLGGSWTHVIREKR